MTNFEITNSTHYSVLSVQLNDQQRTENFMQELHKGK